VSALHFDGPGTLVRHAFTPRDLPPREIDVWLPPEAAGNGAANRPILYCHDGQNLFLPEFSFAGVPWSLHTAALAAASAAGMPVPVVVGIWNSGEGRYREYLPSEPEMRPTGAGEAHLALAYADGGTPCADAYVRMLTEEVVPLIEAEYRLSVTARRRAVLGSSMGGIVSLYAALTRPDVFGAAACVSTNFIVGGEPLVDWFAARLPAPGTSRLWFDRGTDGLDAEYGPLQERMDAAVRASGLVEGRDFETRVYPGADHSEGSWAARATDALAFVLAGMH